METSNYLNELWSLHTSRGNLSSLFQYLEEFVGAYAPLVEHDFNAKDVKQMNIPTGSCYRILADKSIVLDHLPSGLLQLIHTRLMLLQDQCSVEFTIADVRLSTYLVQALIVVCRTGSLALINLSSSIIGHAIVISSQVVAMLRKGEFSKNVRNNENLKDFMKTSLHFLQSIYDPELIWKKCVDGDETQATTNTNVPLINAEIVPFFYETLQIHTGALTNTLQRQLLNTFGSILCGSKRNALLITSATTLEILLKFLSEYMGLESEVKEDTDASMTTDVDSARLVLKIIVEMIHTLHNAGREQCQLDVSTILGEYFKLLTKASCNPDMQVMLLGFLPDILETLDRAALQMMLLNHGCLDHLKAVLENFKSRCGETVTKAQSDEFAVKFVNIVNSLVAGSMSAKDQFSRLLGTRLMLDHFKVICIPSKDIFYALLRMGVETDIAILSNPIKNVFIILMLFDWLPEIKQSEQQVWLSSMLNTLFTSCTANKILAGHCKILSKIIVMLIQYQDLHEQTVLNLLSLTEKLGSYSITPRQTAALVELMRQDSPRHPHMNKYFDNIMKCLSKMSSKEPLEQKPGYFFDLQDSTSGITAPTIKKWGGSGFSLHCWVCLEFIPSVLRGRKRRQLYSFSTDQGTGMEAFFTPDCQLVVAVSTKKNYYTVMLNEYPLADNNWHCVQITHQPARKMFGSNGLLQIYIDDSLKLSTSLRFPTLSSSFTLCNIGSSGHRTTGTPTTSTSFAFANENNSSNADRVVTIDNGSQDEIWGQATSLLGQLGPVAVFNDVLKDTQLKSMYAAGPDMWQTNRTTDSPFDDVPPSKIVLYYEAKACYRHTCRDLSSNEPPRNGTLTGHKIFTWDVKDSINCIGGVMVLTPLLEVIHSRYMNDINSAEKKNDDYCLDNSFDVSILANAPTSNPIRNFLTMLTNFTTSSSSLKGFHSINSEMMIKSSTIATIGALLQKLPLSLLDSELLSSIQHMVQTSRSYKSTGNAILMDVYQYLLFDFRIWCLVGPDLQYEHIQYLSTLIKEEKKDFRSTFGVQYILDVIKTYYCSSDPDVDDVNARNIRSSLLGLIKYYITDDVTMDEVMALLNFISTAKSSNETQICEILNLLKSLWMCQCRDQLCTLLCEPRCASCFYALLGIPDFPDKVRIGVCEFFILLFKARKVGEKHKNLLKQTSVGLHGILWQLQDAGVSPQLAALWVDIAVEIDCDSATFIAILHLLHESTAAVKKYACQRFLTLAYSKTSFLTDCAKQKDWQKTMARLFILEPDRNSQYQERLTSCPSDLDLSNIEINDVSETDGSIAGGWCNHLKINLFNPSGSNLDNESITKLTSENSSEFPSSMSLGQLSSKHRPNELHLPSVGSLYDPMTLSPTFDLSPHEMGKKHSISNGSAVFSDCDTINEYVVVKCNGTKLEGDLVDLLVEGVFLLMWRGVKGSSKAAWMERGQMLASLTNIAECYTLICDCDKIKGSILEHCVEAALSDMREVNYSKDAESSENGAELIRFIYDFLENEGEKNLDLWTGKLMENLYALYDAMLYHPTFADSNVKEFVVPLIRDLLDKNFERLTMGPYLSELPPTTGSHRFFDDFLEYCQSNEWTTFISACVEPNSSEYITQQYSDLSTSMKIFWDRAKEQCNVDHHTRWRERGEMRLRFKAQVKISKFHFYLFLNSVFNFIGYQDNPTQETTLVPPSAVLSSSESSKEDDGVGDEDWSMLAPNANNLMEEQSTKEKLVLTAECHLVTLMDIVQGKLEISTTHVYFYDKSTTTDEDSMKAGAEMGMDFKWSLSQLREVHFRRYNLRKSALELFLIDQTNYFINFEHPNIRHTVYKALLSVRPPNLLYYGTRTPQELLKASGLTQKWVQREVSNFDYLMQLNTIAGRTYNDLSQYPVFPWILTDYTSEKLDLDNPDVYRDLSKPIGVLNEKNEKAIRDRYDQFEDPVGVIKKFHYGSHYSNAATVLFYMLRMEPFTTLHIQLQGGRFDLSDRQFHNLPATFQAMYETSNDVKELIPEFFYLSEFLVNSNDFDLGKLQFSKETVNDVVLPKWAKSATDFTFQHRKALESDYVSNNLHQWIDLIFGYKQRGEESVKACNVFYYCTYEGAVDLNAISDPIHRKAVEGMINNFGQTPTQLLYDPHPHRMTREDAEKKVAGRIMSTLNVGDVRAPNVLEQPDQLKAFFVEIMENSNDPLIYVSVPKNQSHSFMQSGMPDAMVTVSESGVIGTHGWLPYDRSITNYFTFEKDPAVGHSRLQKSVKGLWSPGLHLSANLFLVTHDAKYLFVGGYWDNSIRIMTIKGRTITCLVRHLDVVTCLALDHGGTYMISGSYDTTCIIWKVNQPSGAANNIGAQPLHILYGHEDVVTCVVVNSELDVALSSSKDGTCVIHTVRKGHYVRTIRPISNNPQHFTVPSIALSEEGKIVLYARSKKECGEEKHFLHLYSINGRHIALDCLESRLGHMTVCGEHLVTGDVHGVLIVRELFSFCEISRLSLYRPIACVYVTKGMTHILACLRDGKLIIVGVDKPAKARGLFNT
ncbi:neurobeachin-like protein 1 [Ciona intestinalis]